MSRLPTDWFPLVPGKPLGTKVRFSGVNGELTMNREQHLGRLHRPGIPASKVTTVWIEESGDLDPNVFEALKRKEQDSEQAEKLQARSGQGGTGREFGGG